MNEFSIKDLINVTPETRAAIIKTLSQKQIKVLLTQCEVYLCAATSLENKINFSEVKKLEIIYSLLYTASSKAA